MSVQQVQAGYPAVLAVRLLDSASNPVTGVAYTALTVRYRKHGGAWTSKAVQSAEWTEGPEGRYLLSFSASELDTSGRFVFRVWAPSADVMTGDIDVVEDWAQIVDMLTDLLNGLNTKVGRGDVALMKHQQDDAIGAMNVKVDAAMKDIARINTQLTILLQKLDSLP